MPNCPNCGRPAQRTIDWACQWCGYPLMSNSYKVIPKTYRELKEEEKPARQVPPREEQAPATPRIPAPPPATPVPEVRQEPIAESRVVAEPPSDTTPEIVPESGTKVEPPAESAPDTSSESSPPPLPAEEPVTETATGERDEPRPAIEAAPEPETESDEPGLNVDKLYAEFEADRASAEAKYKDQLIIASGLVYRTVINDNLEIAYLILSSASRFGDKQLSCTFEVEQAGELKNLTEGEPVTVQGKFGGYGANILLRDCELVR